MCEFLTRKITNNKYNCSSDNMKAFLMCEKSFLVEACNESIVYSVFQKIPGLAFGFMATTRVAFESHGTSSNANSLAYSANRS